MHHLMKRAPSLRKASPFPSRQFLSRGVGDIPGILDKVFLEGAVLRVLELLKEKQPTG